MKVGQGRSRERGGGAIIAPVSDISWNGKEGEYHGDERERVEEGEGREARDCEKRQRKEE